MDHFVVYHSVKQMDRRYRRQGRLISFFSSKPESFLRKSIGQSVWVIEGIPQKRGTGYLLIGVYTPSEVSPDEEEDGTWVISGPGEHFLPDVELPKGVPWFDELRNEQNNFSLGFNRIRSVSAIEALGEIRAQFGQRALSPDEVPEALYSEGHSVRITVNRYERDPAARAACLQQFGTTCRVCETDLAVIYGPIAAGLVHIHHLTPLSTVSGDYRVNPATDLIPICPNCHAVAHLRSPPLTPEEIRVLLRKDG